jgi:hypothetical protein
MALSACSTRTAIPSCTFQRIVVTDKLNEKRMSVKGVLREKFLTRELAQGRCQRFGT